MKDTKDAKGRILESACALFASKGFSGVGIREIAANANVNISMISYYYGGKLGILKSIIEEYFHELQMIISSIIEQNLDKEKYMREYIFRVIKLLREKPDLCRVAIIETPIDFPEFSEFKVEMMRSHVKFMKESNKIPRHSPANHLLHIIIGPAIMSLIYSHFLFKTTITKIAEIPLDDKYFDTYSDIISTIFMTGMNGVAQKYNFKFE